MDQATVRVLAMGAPELVTIEEDGTDYHIAVPVAGHGSGVLVTDNGLILTAAHVIEGARAVGVHVPGMRAPLPAKVEYVNDDEDYAFLRVAGHFTNVAALPPPDAILRVRTPVFAIGYPLDVKRMDPQSSRGVVSGKRRDGRLQLDMTVNPGNSGGPVIDEDELLHGIIVTRSDVKAGAMGLAGAVPSSIFRAKLEELAAVETPDVAELQRESAEKLASMVSLLASEGVGVFRGSLEISTEQTQMNQRVRRFAKEMPDSADAQLIAASYFWNRHMIRRAKKEDGQELLAQAERHAKRAAELDPSLVEDSPFLKHVLENAEEKPAASANEIPESSSPRGKFFLHLGGGFGSFEWKSKSVDGVRLNSSFIPLEAMIGGGPEGWVFGGQLSYARDSSTSYRFDSAEGSGWAVVTRVEGFVRWYPARELGFHVGARLGIFGLTADLGRPLRYPSEDGWYETDTYSSSGFSTALAGGYDLPLGGPWALGMAVSVSYLYGFDEQDAGAGVLPSFSLGLVYH